MIHLRRATSKDNPAIRHLFYDTIHSVAAKDYTEAQRVVWSGSHTDEEKWQKRIDTQYFLLAEIEDTLAGMASLTPDGYLDVLYVGKDFQGQGVAKMLLETIEKEARRLKIKEITSDISITARPFFEKKGFEVLKDQKNEIGGQVLINFNMKKNLQTQQ